MIFDSDAYWEKRYADKGNSGDGSYGKLANFKAEIINGIIKDYRIKSVLDYGVGDGNQYSTLNLDNITYYGIDVSSTAISICKNMFPDKSNCFMSVNEYKETNTTCELSMSCDVLYHLIDEDLYHSYLKNLFEFSNKYILIYARNQTKKHADHVYFREFNDYFVNTYKCTLIKKFPNRYPQKILGLDNSTTSPSDFYLYLK